MKPTKKNTVAEQKVAYTKKNTVSLKRKFDEETPGFAEWLQHQFTTGFAKFREKDKSGMIHQY